MPIKYKSFPIRKKMENKFAGVFMQCSTTVRALYTIHIDILKYILYYLN